MDQVFSLGEKVEALCTGYYFDGVWKLAFIFEIAASCVVLDFGENWKDKKHRYSKIDLTGEDLAEQKNWPIGKRTKSQTTTGRPSRKFSPLTLGYYPSKCKPMELV